MLSRVIPGITVPWQPGSGSNPCKDHEFLIGFRPTQCQSSALICALSTYSCVSLLLILAPPWSLSLSGLSKALISPCLLVAVGGTGNWNHSAVQIWSRHLGECQSGAGETGTLAQNLSKHINLIVFVLLSFGDVGGVWSRWSSSGPRFWPVLWSELYRTSSTRRYRRVHATPCPPSYRRPSASFRYVPVMCVRAFGRVCTIWLIFLIIFSCITHQKSICEHVPLVYKKYSFCINIPKFLLLLGLGKRCLKLCLWFRAILTINIYIFQMFGNQQKPFIHLRIQLNKSHIAFCCWWKAA